MVVAWWQIRDLVHGHTPPGPGRDREWIEETERRVPHHLVSLARVPASHVAIDSCCKPRPLLVRGHECLRPCHSLVPRQQGIVLLLQDF